MFDLIKFLDFTSPIPRLYVNSTSRFKNIYGGLLTLVSFLIIFIFSVVLLVKLLKRENMTIIYNEEFIDKPYLNLTNFPIFFEVYNSNGLKFENASRLFKIKSKRYLIQDKLINGTIIKDVNVTPINIIECSVLKNQSDSYYNNYDFKNYDISDKLCLDLSDGHYLTGSTGDQSNQSLLVINIDKCTNTTEKDNCYPNDYIDRTLGRPHLILRFKNNYVNNNNIYHPEVSFLKNELITFNSQMMKMINYQFNTIEYNTDYGYILQDFQRRIFFKHSESIMDSLNLAPENTGILKIQFSMTKTKGIYNRHFEKFQNVIASLGAIIKLLIFIFGYLNSIFNEDYYFNYICNYVNLYEHSKYSSWDYSNNINSCKKKIDKINSISINKKIDIENSPVNDFKDIRSINRDLNFQLFKKNDNNEIIKEKALNESNMVKNNKEADTNNCLINNSQIALNELKKDKSNFLIVNQSFKVRNDPGNSNDVILEQQRIDYNQVIKNKISNSNKSNNNNSSENFFSFNTNFKKKYRLDLNIIDIVRKVTRLFKNVKTKTLDLGISYIKRKISVEEIIRKMLEIDKLKFSLMTKEQINNLNGLTGPNLFSDFIDNNNISSINKNTKRKINKKNTDIFKINIDELWSNYEFERKIYDIEKTVKTIKTNSLAEKMSKFRK